MTQILLWGITSEVSVVRSPHRLAAPLAMHAAELFERASAERDERLFEQCLLLYHPEVQMSSSLNGIAVRTRGRGELRRVILEATSDSRRYRHLNTQVMWDVGDRALLRTTLLVLQRDRPLVAVPIEWRIAVRDALIVESHGRETPSQDQPNWAPLGSTYSHGGEVLARWGSEQLLVRLYDGRPVELLAPVELEGDWEVGDQVMVFYVEETVAGWYLPDKQLGVDFGVRGGRS